MQGTDSPLLPWTLLSSPLAVSASRIRQFNSILLPFGLLSQALAGGEGLPRYLDTAALALVLGHEVVHGLDTSGRGFDLRGRLQQVWDPASLVRYRQKAGCQAKRRWPVRRLLYRGATVQLASRPEDTFNEDLADIQGLELASSVVLAGDLGEALPGLNYTREQAFFLNVAQGYCGQRGALSEILLTHLGQHSSYAERVDLMALHSSRYSTGTVQV